MLRLKDVNFCGLFFSPVEFADILGTSCSIQSLTHSLVSTCEGSNSETQKGFAVGLSCINVLRHQLTELALCGFAIPLDDLNHEFRLDGSPAVGRRKSYAISDQLKILSDFVHLKRLAILNFPLQKNFKFLNDIGKVWRQALFLLFF